MSHVHVFEPIVGERGRYACACKAQAYRDLISGQLRVRKTIDRYAKITACPRADQNIFNPTLVDQETGASVGGVLQRGRKSGRIAQSDDKRQYLVMALWR